MAGSCDSNDHVAGEVWRQRPPYETGGTGALQLAADLVKPHPSHNPIPLVFLYPWETWTIVHNGEHNTPTAKWTSPRFGEGPTGHRAKDAYIGFHRRRVQYQGHKVGRLSGQDWMRARARQYYLASGGEFYPRWDPDQREPQETL
jgi:hypothetical protein